MGSSRARRLTRILATPESRPALEAWVRDSGTLEAGAAADARAETLQGRGAVHVVPAPVGTGRWVVRHYRRGGAVARALGDRYLRLGEPRPFREFRTGRQLEDMGVPVPRHVGAAVYAAGPWYRGDLVTQLVPDSRDLAAVLFGGPTGRVGAGPVGAVSQGAAMIAAGRLVRLLHERGVHHRDLNLKNILIAPSAGGEKASPEGGVRALVLDLDRATVGKSVGPRVRRRMLKRFWRSAGKFEAATGRALAPELRAAFERGYGSVGG